MVGELAGEVYGGGAFDCTSDRSINGGVGGVELVEMRTYGVIGMLDLVLEPKAEGVWWGLVVPDGEPF